MRRQDVLSLLLVLAALQLLGVLVRALARRPQVQAPPRWYSERAREVDEAFEDALRLNEQRGSVGGAWTARAETSGQWPRCWCGEPGATWLPNWGWVCSPHFTSWSAGA